MKFGLKSAGKKILLVACIALLAISATAATMAFFTDESEDVNTFVLGNVKMTIDEAKVTPDGVPIVENGEPVRTSENNTYHLVPGGTYTKDPTITLIGGGSDSYIRMIVTLKGCSQIKEVFGEDFVLDDIVGGRDENIWIYSGEKEDNENNAVIYEYRYYKIAEGSEKDVCLEPLFETLVLPESVTITDIRTLAENIEISVIGHGIQSAGFDTAEEAWKSFDIQISG